MTVYSGDCDTSNFIDYFILRICDSGASLAYDD